MLYTNLKHIERAADHARIVNENKNVLVICGRMGPSCIPVYRIAEELEKEYPNVQFYDMEYDNPESNVIRTLSEVKDFMSIPFTIYYKNGEVIKATSGNQTKAQVSVILDHEYVAALIDGN